MRSIILSSFLEAVRDRVLIVVLVFGVLMIFISFLMGPLSLGEDIRIAVDTGLMAISFFGLLVILFVGNRSLYREINKKTCYLVITRPVSRFQFIVSKTTGIFLTILVTSLILGFIYFVQISILKGEFIPQLMLAVTGIIFQLFILSSFIVFFSTFLNQFIGSILTILVFILGQVIPKTIPLAMQQEQMVVSRILHISHFIIPDFTYLDFRELVLYNNPIPVERIFFAFPYAITFCLTLIFIASVIFERKDL